MWSATILYDLVVSWSFLYSNWASSLILSIIPWYRSVSYTESTPWSTAIVLSSPIPVSTFFWLRGSNLPSAVLLYSIKTSFHISTYLPQLQAGEQSLEHFSLPVSINISVSGPQGPVRPAGPHQLCSFGRKNIWSSATPSPRQCS